MAFNWSGKGRNEKKPAASKFCNSTSHPLVDLKAVEGLPDSWAVACGESAVIHEYLSNRKNRYNEIRKKIEDEAKSINKNIEDDIRLESYVYLGQIEEFKMRSQRAYEETKLQDTFDTIDKLKKIHEERIYETNWFKNRLLYLEAHRTEQLKVLLKSNFYCLIGTMEKIPQEIMNEMNTEIFEANRQLLSNIRTHLQLCRQLSHQSEEEHRRLLANVEEVVITRELSEIVAGASKREITQENSSDVLTISDNSGT